MLEVVVADETAHAVVVIFNELEVELIKCSADCLIQLGDEDDSGLPTAIKNLIGTTHVMELKSRTYYEHGSYKSFTCWKIVSDDVALDAASSNNQMTNTDEPKQSSKILTKQPSMPTPSISEKRSQMLLTLIHDAINQVNQKP